MVADETQRLGERLLELIGAARFDELASASFDARAAVEAERLELLSVNSAIEALKFEGGKGVALCADGIRKAALDFSALVGAASGAAWTSAPEAAEPSLASSASTYLLAFEIAGLRFVEALPFIREVMSLDLAQLEGAGGQYDLRGRKIALVEPRAGLGLPPAPTGEGLRLVVLNRNWSGRQGEEVALVVDRIPAEAVFRSRIGIATRPRTRAFPEGFLRECWDASDGGQFFFADWLKAMY
ncbi:MAG TPA: chemotaxis protein CheW [Rectinemataceae bacterium]|nr:chemotaxis protein CheW [Rectinemataceae bacterium]